MRGALRAWQVSRDLPQGAAIGLTSEGVWATSFLKEYPPAFCAGLAEGFIQSLQKHSTVTDMAVKSDFVQTAQKLIVKEFGQCAGPDFAK